MIDRHSLPSGSRPDHAVRNNGPTDLAIERYKLRELAEGWPCYRCVISPHYDALPLHAISDSCEWENFASLFHDDAHVYTTWSGRIHFRDFIAASQKGMDAGAFIMHRVYGTTTDILPDASRAVTKMKSSITQRFVLAGAEVDVDVEVRFCFFWEKDAAGDWKARLVRHWYEKDRLIPVDPRKIPAMDDTKLATYPAGYRYLAYCQEATMGVKVMLDLPYVSSSLHRFEQC
jgi:hypothetical protein